MVDTESILTSIKKLLGMDPTFVAFDEDIIMHIYSAFSSLSQLGVGPVEGFSISDAESKWNFFVADNRLNSVRTYVYYKVRLAFDPPATSYAIAAMERMLKEEEWRLNVQAETGALNE